MRKEKDKSKLWVWIKNNGDLIIILLVLLGLYLNINSIHQRIDITNAKMSELNREIGEMRTELDCCKEYYINP